MGHDRARFHRPCHRHSVHRANCECEPIMRSLNLESSSAVELATVNRAVGGSNPPSSAISEAGASDISEQEFEAELDRHQFEGPILFWFQDRSGKAKRTSYSGVYCAEKKLLRRATLASLIHRRDIEIAKTVPVQELTP